jgi:hypothetical protein
MLLEADVQPTSVQHAYLLPDSAQHATGRSNPAEICPVLRDSAPTAGSEVTDHSSAS